MTVSATQAIRQEHAAIAAVLRSLQMMIGRGFADQPERFFDVLRAMLFYIDEFPEKNHHPKESDLLFPKLVRARPEMMAVVRRLEGDHILGEGKVRELQHLLLAWELLGDIRRQPFVDAADEYVAFYLEHMRVEEQQLLPAVDAVLSPQELAGLASAFQQNRDPLAVHGRDPSYDRLFTRIVLSAPSPIGVGDAGKAAARAG